MTKRINNIVILLIFIIGVIYGIQFSSHFPTISISQDELYGNENEKLKDFSFSNGGLLVAESEDPWIECSFDTPVPILGIEINASDVIDLDGNLQIFNTENWEYQVENLHNGKNTIYLYSKDNLWVTQNLRFDLVEKIGAQCKIESIVINPRSLACFLGFIIITMPLGALLTLVNFICKKSIWNCSNRNELLDTALKGIWALITACCTVYACRIPRNSTSIFIATVIVFLIWRIPLPRMLRYDRFLLSVFSILLATASVFAGHIVIGNNPYYDLIDKSYVTQFDWKDYCSTLIFSVFLYRCLRCLEIGISKFAVYVSKIRKNQSSHVSYMGCMAVLVLCWIPWLVAYYPGFIFGDSTSSLYQAIGRWELSNHHPVLYTLFLKQCILIGKLYGDLTFGCALYSLAQILFVAFALSKMLEWLSDHGCPLPAIIFSLGWFAISPFFGQLSIAMWKDPIFGGAMVLLTVNLLKLRDLQNKDGNSFVPIRNVCIKLVADILLVCFSRNNGIYIIVFTLLVSGISVFFAGNKKYIIGYAVPAFAAMGIYFAVSGPLYAYWGVLPTETVESLGVPLNQMASVAAYPDGIMSEDDRAFLNKLLPIEQYPTTYRPCVVDLLKWDKNFNNEYLDSHTDEFVKTYVSLGIKNPVKYIKAWAMMTFGYWAPNGWELANIANNLSVGDFTALYNTDLQIHTVNPSDPPSNFIYKILTIRGTVIPLGFVSWIVFLTGTVMLIKNKWCDLISISPSLGNILTLLIASPFWYWPRYGTAQLYLLPLYCYFIFILFRIDEENDRITGGDLKLQQKEM